MLKKEERSRTFARPLTARTALLRAKSERSLLTQKKVSNEPPTVKACDLKPHIPYLQQMLAQAKLVKQFLKAQQRREEREKREQERIA